MLYSSKVPFAGRYIFHTRSFFSSLMCCYYWYAFHVNANGLFAFVEHIQVGILSIIKFQSGWWWAKGHCLTFVLQIYLNLQITRTRGGFLGSNIYFLMSSWPYFEDHSWPISAIHVSESFRRLYSWTLLGSLAGPLSNTPNCKAHNVTALH